MKLLTRLSNNARSGNVAFIEGRGRVALLAKIIAAGAAVGGGGGQEEEAEEGKDDGEDRLHFVFIASGYKVGWIGF